MVAFSLLHNPRNASKTTDLLVMAGAIEARMFGHSQKLNPRTKLEIKMVWVTLCEKQSCLLVAVKNQPRYFEWILGDGHPSIWPEHA